MFCLATANAATLAVLEITLASDDEMSLTIDETRFLTDELRRQAARILPKEYSVLTRDKIISLVPKTAENLTSVIDIGTAIKSDYVTHGFIGKLGSLFTLTVELYETASGNLLGDFVKESTELKGLLDAIRENAPDLFSKIMPKEEPKPETVNVPEIVNIPETISEPQPITIPANIPAEPKKSKNSFWVAIGLDVLGAAAFGLGIYNNSRSVYYSGESKKLWENVPDPVPYPNEYLDSKNAFDAKYKKMQNAETARNIFYATGCALLLGGIAVHIWF
jgi:hypothetical protein